MSRDGVTSLERVQAERYFQQSQDAMQPLAPVDMAVARGELNDMDEDLSQACAQSRVAAESLHLEDSLV